MPVLIDPAVYFGIGASDLGMTTLLVDLNRHFMKAIITPILFPIIIESNGKCVIIPLLIHLNYGKSYLTDISNNQPLLNCVMTQRFIGISFALICQQYAA